MEKYLSNSVTQTKEIAANLARNSTAHVFALSGELGAGKTVFVKGFAEGLGIKEKIISPTFVLIRQHPIPATRKVLYHIDLYRLSSVTDLKNLGLEEILSDPNNIVLIEWVEKLKKLPKESIRIEITRSGPYSRLISISKGPTI